MNSIPIDLVFEIFSRLPSNSIARCRCVSKLWWSMLHHPDFTELFLTRSSTRPRLLFVMGVCSFRKSNLFFYSLPQPQNPYQNLSSLVVAAKFHKKLHKELNLCGHASGLFCFRHIQRMPYGVYDDITHVICNPSIGQCRILPKLENYKESNSFLGFDPIDKQFKVLCMSHPNLNKGYGHDIMTLGTGKMRWRKILCPLSHYKYSLESCDNSPGICINGVLYYLAQNNYVTTDGQCDNTMVIACFDVRSEKFKFIAAKPVNLWSTKFINYKGKLAGINWKYNDNYDIDGIELCVLEDVQKQEWSEYFYTLPENKIVEWSCDFSVVGVTATGEIVLTSGYTFRSKPFYVFYLNPQRNSLQSVEIRCFTEYYDVAGYDNSWHKVYAFVDQVEDLRFDIIKTIYAERSSKAHLQQHRHTIESTNKFDALRLLDDEEFTGVKT